MKDLNGDRVREYLHWTNALLQSMEIALRGENPANPWKYGGYRQFARKYNQLIEVIRKNVTLPPIVDIFDIDKIAGVCDTIPIQQKELFEAVHANASILRGFLENKAGVVEDETAALRNFFRARLRSAILVAPKKEREVQDVVEQLLIGRGLQKGEDYDREVGRVKMSAKETIPDFILIKLGLALELKLITTHNRMKEVVDEINADIAAYSKVYRTLLFVVYDTGYIRNEVEFRGDLERAGNVSVIVVKH